MKNFLCQSKAAQRRSDKSAESGASLIEFAFALPILLTALVGAIELTRYTLVNQKVGNTVAALAKVIAAQPVDIDLDYDDFLTEDSLKALMSPFSPSHSDIIVSKIELSSEDGEPHITAQSNLSFGWSKESQIGEEGGVADIEPLNVPAGRIVYVVEYYYQYKNILGDIPLVGKTLGFSDDGEVYHRAFFRARQVDFNRPDEVADVTPEDAICCTYAAGNCTGTNIKEMYNYCLDVVSAPGGGSGATGIPIGE